MTQDQSLPRSTPEAQGIPSAAVRAFVDSAERDALGLHSLMLVRHGHVVAEGWWDPYRPEAPHMLFSLSKSFTSTAAGMAIAGARFSLDDPVLSFFPEDAPAEVGPNLAAMRVRHLLSMSTGHDQDTLGRVARGQEENWVRAFLAQPVEHEPGTHFVYNSGATYMVSAIIQTVTGDTLLDYLRPRLFEPLGITDPTWETDPRGINTGGWGLSVRTEDIARFGQLYLQKGVWNGARLLSEAWVDEATSKQVPNGDNPDSDWNQGYGYQFWRCRHGAYRGDGAFGQFCVVLPAQDAVVAITAGTSDLQGVLNHVWEHLLPAMAPAALPEDGAAQDRLLSKLASLTLPPPQGARTSPTAARVSGKTYRFEPGDPQDENDPGVEAVTWGFAEDGCTLALRDKRGQHRIEAGADRWRPGTTTFAGHPNTPTGTPRPIAAQGVWSDTETYVLTLWLTETPFSLTLTARFAEDRVSLQIRQNVSFGPAERPPLEGRLA